MIYRCNFGLISYSIEDLIVIHSRVYGSYNSEVHDHIPQYFKRFDVPLQVGHKRIFVIE